MRSRLASLAVLGAAALACAPQEAARTVAANVVPPREVYCGEDTCPPIQKPGACQFLATWLSIPGQFADVFVQAPAVGQSVVTQGGDIYKVNVEGDRATFQWWATRPVSFVAGTHGYDSNVYVYAPPAREGAGLSAWAGLPLDQVLFCVDATKPQLTVSTTASAGFTRRWSWSIAKSSPTRTVSAAIGATVDVDYAVTVAAAPVDGAYVVTGAITIQNPSAVAATGVSVAASLGGAALTPDCGPFDGTLAPAAALTCLWSTAPGAAVDATALVTVATAGPSFTASATATFGAPTAVVDGCVTVTDDRAGPLGQVCAVDGPRTFSYRHAVGPYAACAATGDGYPFSNTATFSAPTGATGASTFTVNVAVPCASAGCTLTQGYWKTHSKEGPAPYDARWKNVGPLEEDTPFFRSGQTWIQVLRSPVRGSAYLALAHAYAAAKLNVLAGASGDALGGTLAAAEAFLAASTPTAGLTPARRAEVLGLAALLQEFNAGLVGPGHCDDVEPGGGCSRDEPDPGDACDDRCDGREHDGEEHERCRERHDADDRHDEGHDGKGGKDEEHSKDDGKHGQAAGGKDGAVHAQCLPPPPPPPKPDDEEARCRKHEEEDRRWDEVCRPHPHHDDPHHGGCRHPEKHRECHDHDAQDRAHGCADRAKHPECRDPDRDDAERDG